jgi:hypothetical protein
MVLLAAEEVSWVIKSVAGGQSIWNEIWLIEMAEALRGLRVRQAQKHRAS